MVQQKNNRLHLLVWHTYAKFSKSHFKAGKYQRLSLNRYLNDSSGARYVSRILMNRNYIYFVFNIIDLEDLD